MVTAMTTMSSCPSTSAPNALFSPRHRAFQHLWLVAPDQPCHEAQQEADCNRQNHDRKLRLPEDAAQDRALQRPADRGHDEDRADAGDPERQAQVRVVAEADATKAPSIIMSPCAKLTCSVAL